MVYTLKKLLFCLLFPSLRVGVVGGVILALLGCYSFVPISQAQIRDGDSLRQTDAQLQSLENELLSQLGLNSFQSTDLLVDSLVSYVKGRPEPIKQELLDATIRLHPAIKEKLAPLVSKKFRISLTERESDSLSGLKSLMSQVYGATSPDAVKFERLYSLSKELERLFKSRATNELLGQRAKPLSLEEKDMVDGFLDRYLVLYVKECQESERYTAGLRILGEFSSDRLKRPQLEAAASLLNAFATIAPSKAFAAPDEEVQSLNLEGVVALLERLKKDGLTNDLTIVATMEWLLLYYVAHGGVDSAVLAYSHVIQRRPDPSQSNTDLRYRIAFHAGAPDTRPFASGRIKELKDSGELTLTKRINLMLYGSYYENWWVKVGAIALWVSVFSLIISGFIFWLCKVLSATVRRVLRKVMWWRKPVAAKATRARGKQSGRSNTKKDPTKDPTKNVVENGPANLDPKVDGAQVARDAEIEPAQKIEEEPRQRKNYAELLKEELEKRRQAGDEAVVDKAKEERRADKERAKNNLSVWKRRALHIWLKLKRDIVKVAERKSQEVRNYLRKNVDQTKFKNRLKEVLHEIYKKRFYVPKIAESKASEDEYSNLLAVFGLADDASEEEIKHRYRDFAKMCHPDSIDEAETVENAEELNTAFVEITTVYNRIMQIRSRWFGNKMV